MPREKIKEATILIIAAAASLLVLFLAGWAERPLALPLWAIVCIIFLVLIAYSLLQPVSAPFLRGRHRQKGAYYLINNLLWKPEWKEGQLLPGAPLCNWCQTEVLILPGKAAYHQTITSQCPSCGAINEYPMSYPQLLEEVVRQLPARGELPE